MENKYCDLHMHTIYSDGIFGVEEILKICEKEKLSVIAITDHDSNESCFYMDKIDTKKYFSGDIVDGCEICCVCNRVPIEILTYGFDKVKLKKILKKYNFSLIKVDQFRLKLLYKIFNDIDNDFYCNLDNIIKNDDSNCCRLYNEACKSEKIFDCIKKVNLDESYSEFFRKGINNPNSMFYCDASSLYPLATKVVEDVHDCGGLAFVAHPFVYGEHYLMVLETMKDIVDGIECFHPTGEGKTDWLKNFAKKNGLYTSGGSDFHGYRGNVNSVKVKLKDCEEWLNKVKKR